MRIVDESTIYLEEGEIVPCKCGNCGWFWQPACEAPTYLCPVCGFETKAEDISFKDEQE